MDIIRFRSCRRKSKKLNFLGSRCVLVIQVNQVKFYCAIRLAFVKKDHQLVYRYNTENKINKLKLKRYKFKI